MHVESTCICVLIECPRKQHGTGCTHVAHCLWCSNMRMFDCMCHFSTEHEQHACACVIFGTFDEHANAGRFNMYSRLIQHAQYQHVYPEFRDIRLTRDCVYFQHVLFWVFPEAIAAMRGDKGGQQL